MRNPIAVALLLAGLQAAAQTPPPEAEKTSPPETDTAARIAELEARLKAEEEKSADWGKFLEPFKLSGYVQARYVYEQGDPAESFFTVRRSRLKPTYTTDWGQFLIEVDLNPANVNLREAEATLYEPWSGRKMGLTVGQTKWPFGWEISQSSSLREFPERARVTRAFAQNERDRGAKVNATLGVFRLNAGVFNGNGITTPDDNDASKDVVGRLSFDLKWLSGGVSGWWGETLRPEEDGGGFFPRNRLGLDAQLTLDELLPIGGTQLRAEYLTGRTYFRSGVEQFGVPALGWYAILVQGLGKQTHLAVRYDYFDGLAGTSDTANAEGRPSSRNAVGTLGFAVMHTFGKFIEATAAYEVPITGVPAGATDPEDNVFTFQLQAKI